MSSEKLDHKNTYPQEKQEDELEEDLAVTRIGDWDHEKREVRLLEF